MAQSFVNNVWMNSGASFMSKSEGTSIGIMMRGTRGIIMYIMPAPTPPQIPGPMPPLNLFFIFFHAFFVLGSRSSMVAGGGGC